MSLTPNFGFNIPTGTDTVNLLTQCYPNFTSLDTILQAIKESGVTTATATKSGSTHQIVRTVADCDVFRFVATANYSSGDLFTVDGSPVTATAVNGTALPTGAFVINQSVFCILNGSVLTVAVAGSGDAQNIAYDNTGSGLTASNVQDAIDEVVGDIPTGFAATAISYDNSGSGLSATNAQDAIDELATAGANHGYFEKWINPTPNASFADEVVTFASDVEFDALEFYIEERTGETLAPIVYAIDKEVTSSNFRLITAGGFDTATPLTMSIWTRPVSISYAANTYTITFGHNIQMQKAVNSSAAASATNADANMIPVRILGLIHNS